jgi:uncharacterized Zn-binding protein involved in type VI secretion
MSGEIIRMGDRTSHGGTVLEGSPADICMGKPISFIGHKTQCPKCRGTFPIVEGVLTTTFYGKGVAVAGMKTACGAVLIASQFTDIVEWSPRSSSKATDTSERLAATSGTATSEQPNSRTPIAGGAQTASDEFEIEEYYSLTDGKGNPLTHYRYDLYVDGALHTKAGAYSFGQTAAATGNSQTHLVTWLGKDSASKT